VKLDNHREVAREGRGMEWKGSSSKKKKKEIKGKENLGKREGKRAK